MYNLILEIVALSNVFIINGYGILKKELSILLLYWACILFAISYEIHSVGFQWTYPGYNLYVFKAIPFAIIFGWSWCICYVTLLSKKIRSKFNLKKWYHPIITDYVIGCLIGGVFENIAVYLDWWVYSNPKLPLLPFAPFTIWFSWGIPVAIVIHLVRWTLQNLGYKSIY
jgi:hypothetical protein